MSIARTDHVNTIIITYPTSLENSFIILSPICTQRWGHNALPCLLSLSLCATSSVSVSPIDSLQRFLPCRSNTRRLPNAGLMLAHCPRRCANISPVLGYPVVFGVTLNVD